MPGILISETTKEERERIVAESIGHIDGLCDGCSAGVIGMYQPYIDGKKELREINQEYVRSHSHWMESGPGQETGGCGYAQ